MLGRFGVQRIWDRGLREVALRLGRDLDAQKGQEKESAGSLARIQREALKKSSPWYPKEFDVQTRDSVQTGIEARQHKDNPEGVAIPREPERIDRHGESGQGSPEPELRGAERIPSSGRFMSCRELCRQIDDSATCEELLQLNAVRWLLNEASSSPKRTISVRSIPNNAIIPGDLLGGRFVLERLLRRLAADGYVKLRFNGANAGACELDSFVVNGKLRQLARKAKEIDQAAAEASGADPGAPTKSSW